MKKLSLVLALAVFLSGCALLGNSNLVSTANQFANMPEGKERCKLLATDLNLAASIKMFAGEETTNEEIQQGAAGFELMAAAGCYNELAISTNDVEVCKEIKALDARMKAEFPDETGADYEDAMTLEDTCYMGLATEKKDAKYCDYAGAAVREICRMSADPEAQAAFVEDAEDIYNFEDSDDEYADQAASGLEDTRDETSNSDFIDQEVVDATLDTNDLAGCLSESSNTDLCYDAFARKFQKTSLCTKIISTELRDSCKDSLGA